MLSKKRPLETAIAFAIDDKVNDRVRLPFFRKAFELAGIEPVLQLSFSEKNRSRLGSRNGLKDVLDTSSGNSEVIAGSGRVLSRAMATYLTTEFDDACFSELEQFVGFRAKKGIVLTLDESGASGSTLSKEAVRLALLSDEISLADAKVVSRRRSHSYSVFELSSGEYHILTSLLGLGFSVRSDSVVLIDEPENSLHPQWQQEFMDILFGVCEIMRDGHVVISTHSPLIVSSSIPRSTIVDLSPDLDSLVGTTASFGASTDEILFEQFGIASSRNRAVVEVVRKAVELVERGDDKSEAFTAMRPELEKIKSFLKSGDPLVDVLDALLLDENSP